MQITITSRKESGRTKIAVSTYGIEGPNKNELVAALLGAATAVHARSAKDDKEEGKLMEISAEQMDAYFSNSGLEITKKENTKYVNRVVRRLLLWVKSA